MSTQPFMWPFSLFAPQNLNQPILPDWSFAGVNVNYAGDPNIEKEVVSKVASFGKQLGIISEAVLALADGKPDDNSIARLREIVERIAKLKAENKASLREHADDAMERLPKVEPDAAARIAARYAGKSSA